MKKYRIKLQCSPPIYSIAVNNTCHFHCKLLILIMRLNKRLLHLDGATPSISTSVNKQVLQSLHLDDATSSSNTSINERRRFKPRLCCVVFSKCLIFIYR